MEQYIDKIEDINLIRKDTCARLQSGIFLELLNPEDNNRLHFVKLDEEYWSRYACCEVLESVPILRSLSSMTCKEREEYNKIRFDHSDCLSDYCAKIIDFYIAHYFDYRGLIKQNLAREDTIGIYKIL